MMHVSSLNKTIGLAIVTSLLLLASCVAFCPQRVSPSRPAFSLHAASKSVVVVSPAGGVGEVAAVKAAEYGSAVRWFVVSQKSTDTVSLSPESLSRIEQAGGSIELAGADMESLLTAEEALKAVSTWCGTAESMICTQDGVEVAKRKRGEDLDPIAIWKNAIKVAAKEAAQSISGTKIAILSAEEAIVDDEEDEDSEGIGKLVGGLLGRTKLAIPSSLVSAMSSSSSDDRLVKLRHGQLFGTPESSPDFSPLINGPRREPELCEEYAMRAVRVDPTVSVTGNMMMGSTTRSSRHAVGEAAALLTTSKIPVQVGLDVCVSAQKSIDAPSEEVWKKEFERVLAQKSASGTTMLFQTDFSSVPDVERLADWLATKWAPTVLQTYDLASIRTGARPVYASRAGPGQVEIVWQELVNFESVLTGKMIITVTADGLEATRGPGSAAAGFGQVSRKPLAGEDALVRRLAEAASQAMEKGLAVKPKVVAPPPPAKPVVEVVEAPAAVPVTTAAAAAPESSASGPRQAGAQRSTERARGTRRKKTE